MWQRFGLPGRDFVASWNPVLWLVWSGLVACGSTLIVLAGWVGKYRWGWMIDLVLVTILAVSSVVAITRILRPADDLISVLFAAAWLYLVPALIINLAVFVLMLLIGGSKSHG